MTSSTHLKLPFILPGQAQKHITHNEAVAALDTLTQLAVLDRDLSAPPSAPATGARYIVAAAPTGDWSGKTGQIATWDGSAWLFHAPQPGWLAFVLDENGLLAWSGSAWLPTLGLRWRGAHARRQRHTRRHQPAGGGQRRRAVQPRVRRHAADHK